jgi:NAD(P)-dependent dehydrogenase (short-subunit alcohol dehydrogenase family)
LNASSDPRRAVVTGAARGIGAAIADRLVTDGFDVIRLDVLDAAGVVGCDVTDAAAVRRAAESVGAVDVLVNNAAIWRFAALEDVDPSDFADVLDINVRGPFLTTQAFGRGMLDRGRGSIVNVVSIAALHPNPAVGAYSASKAALVALTRQTALEWGPRGVRANAVGPGLIVTEGAGMYHDEDVRRARASAVPMGRLGTPDDIADVVSFFASDQSAYVSGQVLYVDGGLSSSLMTTLPRPADTPGPQLPAGPAENQHEGSLDA